MSGKVDLTTKLLASFKDLIAEGALSPGTRLPPERELAQRFGVSRPSLRHALKVLGSMGVISQKVGSGTYLNKSAADMLDHPLEFLILLDDIPHAQLIDTRLILEPELAARAAENATAEHLRILEAGLDPLLSGIEESVQADIAFHAAIYAASGNLLCQRLFSALHRAMISTMRFTSRRVDWKHTLGFHGPIFDAIHRRSPADARAAMIAHLTNAREILNGATGASDPAAIRPLAR